MVKRFASPFTALIITAVQGSTLAQSPIPDRPFVQEYHESHPLNSAEENDVRALAVDKQGRLWAATGAGIRCLEKGSWISPPGGPEVGPAYCTYRDPIGGIWAGGWNGLYRAGIKSVYPAGLSGSPIAAVTGVLRGRDVEIFAAGPHGIWRGRGGRWSRVNGSWNRAVRALFVTRDDVLWVGTGSGLYCVDLNHAGSNGTRFSKPTDVLSSNINTLADLQNGAFAVGSTGGVDLYRRRRTGSLTVMKGLPARDSRSIARDSEGRLWIATNIGVARYDRGRFVLWHSKRWLQSDDTRAVAIGSDGTAWVATSAGVDAIRRRSMTLAEKANFFLKMVRARHIRPPGLVGPAVLEKPGDLTKSFIEDDDNDGEHTGMYCAMESMRYAVTKSPDARENAKVAFHALMALQRATGTHHFIARSILPAGTAPRHEVDRTFTPQEIADSNRTDPREKIIEKRWIPTADGKWLWKRDASSDEIDGHMFGYATYYDLAADSEERKLVADQVDRIIGGIVDHGFVLQDIDGHSTRWGNWSPQSLNNDPTWHEERPGNSVEILAHLGVAYHITGKRKYRDAAVMLVAKHGYGKNILETRSDTPSEATHINAELLSMVYPTLINHLVLPSLRRAALTSFKNWHDSWINDGIPFYDFPYNRYSGNRVPLDRAVTVLREWPLDLIEWTVDNSRREDVTPDRTPGREPAMLTRILSRIEMGICMWDQEPYKAVIGNGGAREDKPTDWLLAYWMGRYYGLIAAPSVTSGNRHLGRISFGN